MTEKRDAKRAQCVIHLSEGGRGQSMLDAVVRLRGVSKAEVDSLNRAIVVEYDPRLVTFEEIRASANSERSQ